MGTQRRATRAVDIEELSERIAVLEEERLDEKDVRRIVRRMYVNAMYTVARAIFVGAASLAGTAGMGKLMTMAWRGLQAAH